MGRRGKGKSRLLPLCILKFVVFLSLWHFSFHLLRCQHADLILTLTNNATLLSNIIFHPRLSKHFTNAKEVAIPLWDKARTCWLHIGCCSVCTSLADVILILQWFKSWNCRILEFLLISLFLHSRVSMTVKLTSWFWPLLLEGCFFHSLDQESVALCLNSYLIHALESQGIGVRLEQGPHGQRSSSIVLVPPV